MTCGFEGRNAVPAIVAIMRREAQRGGPQEAGRGLRSETPQELWTADSSS